MVWFLFRSQRYSFQKLSRKQYYNSVSLFILLQLAHGPPFVNIRSLSGAPFIGVGYSQGFHRFPDYCNSALIWEFYSKHGIVMKDPIRQFWRLSLLKHVFNQGPMDQYLGD